MAADRDVVHRDKGVSRGGAIASGILAAGFGAMGVAAVFAADVSLGFVALPVILAGGAGLTGLLRAIVRSCVTQDELIVRSGLNERRIAIGSITAQEHTPATWATPEGVKVTWVEEGHKRVLWVASKDPNTLLHVLAAQRRRAMDQRVKVRVEVEDIDAEAKEAALELEARAARRSSAKASSEGDA